MSEPSQGMSAGEAVGHGSEANPLHPTLDRRSYSPLYHLVLARLKEFYREPEAVFWVYGFPILMVVALGIAFRNRTVESLPIVVVEGAGAVELARDLAGATTEGGKRQVEFKTHVASEATARLELRTAKVALAIFPPGQPVARVDGGTAAADGATATGGSPSGASGAATGYRYLYDPSRPESLVARASADDFLQRRAGRGDVVPVADVPFVEPGGRYIDFLVPGLLGMSIMGGGLWGVGFVTVDMRIRKLLKRFLATPMKKSQFLGGLMISRLMFLIPEVLVLLIFARLFFAVRIYGNPGSLLVVILLGAAAFAGLGLLVASRAKTVEAVSGLMNLVMLPMWVFSGVFFSSERFPEVMHPLIQALPLTVLNNALRAIMSDGSTLTSQWPALATLALWASLTFLVAVRVFRWN
ncbi:MAG: ABC transporter permease [Pirellulales bacterium]